MTDRTPTQHRFGLGSSTRGKTMDEQNLGRSEAEFRAEREAKQKVTWKEQK